MKISGCTLRDHFRLLAPLFGIIAAVWLLRLILFTAGAPFPLVRVMSVTVAGAVSVLLAVLLMYGRRFGSYPNVAVASFLLIFWQQFLIVSAIAFSILTGTRNIYMMPEFAHHFTLRQHILGHLTFGVGLGTLYGTAMGCLLLWLLRRLVPLEGSGKELRGGASDHAPDQ